MTDGHAHPCGCAPSLLDAFSKMDRVFEAASGARDSMSFSGGLRPSNGDTIDDWQ